MNRTVPVEPTTEMFDAGFSALEKQYRAEPLDDALEKVTAVWQAMLSAAPTPADEPVAWRDCEFCGCYTNAKLRRCCLKGSLADKEAGKLAEKLEPNK